MSFFTKKGDDGTTKLYGEKAKIFSCDQRISKSSNITEALGSLDEVNSFLGLCKVQSIYLGYQIEEKSFAQIVHDIQKDLFIIQAELAGADKTISEDKIKELEEVIDQIEKNLPPIKSFFISGGSTNITKQQLSGAGLGAMFDIARTIARRAERRVVAVDEEVSQLKLPIQKKEGDPISNKDISFKVSENSKSYLNRLSSILYALARYANHLAGIEEEAPDYR